MFHEAVCILRIQHGYHWFFFSFPTAALISSNEGCVMFVKFPVLFNCFSRVSVNVSLPSSSAKYYLYLARTSSAHTAVSRYLLLANSSYLATPNCLFASSILSKVRLDWPKKLPLRMSLADKHCFHKSSTGMVS